MPFLLDILVLGIIALMVFIGVKRGFVKSVVRLIGCLLAVVVALAVSGAAAASMYVTLLEQPLEAMVAQKISQGIVATEQTLEAQVEAVVDELPGFVQKLSEAGYSLEDLSGDALTGEQLIAAVMERVVEPVCLLLLQMVLFLVFFVICWLVIKLLSSLLDKVFSSLPVVKRANMILGGAVGFVEGALVVLVFAMIVNVYMSFTGEQSVISNADVGRTVLLELAMELNPFI